MNIRKIGEDLHEHVPANWYFESLKIDPFQKYWHNTRFREVKKMITPADYVLDVGCADGVFSNIIFKKSRAKKFIGVDIVKTSIDWAKKHWKKERNMKFMVGDAHQLNFNDNTFDAVFCLEALEHVVNPVKVFKEFKRVMKKDGYGIFLVPSDSHLFKIVWWLWLHFYPRGWVWKETHIQSFRNNYLPIACKKAGFTIEADRKFNLGMLHLVKVVKK